MKSVGATIRSPSRHEFKLIKARAEIDDKRPSAAEKAFLALPLVQVTLPHSKRGLAGKPVWTRKNGDLTLIVRPGWDHTKNQPLGYPTGTKPRLILFWLTREALRLQSRRIHLSNSLTDFLLVLGLNPNNGTGKRSDYRALQAEMQRLFKATVSLEYSDDQHKSWLDMQVAPKGQLWWDPKSPGQTGLFESWIELGEQFYEALTRHPIPLDIRALHALKGSAFQLDIYALAAYKAFYTYRRGKSSFVTWRQLHAQIGSNLSDLDNFRKHFLRELKIVKSVYPTLDVEIVQGSVVKGGGKRGKILPGGIMFKPSPPPVDPYKNQLIKGV